MLKAQVQYNPTYKPERLDQDTRYDTYITRLKELGVQIHPAIALSYFTLPNGLNYPGVMATTPITANQVLVRVPIDLLITGYQARLQPGLAEVFKQPFYSTETVRNDRILIAYCLYIYSQGDDSSHRYRLISHLPKQVDIAAFWSPEELSLSGDGTLLNSAKQCRQLFQKDYELFSTIRSRHSILQSQFFDYEHYKWIHIHVISRCFGSFLGCDYFVPFCQFFNHGQTDVTYRCIKSGNNSEGLKVNDEDKDNGSRAHQNQSQISDKQLLGGHERPLSQTSETDILIGPNLNLHRAESMSSVSSSQSVDYIRPGDYSYDSLNIRAIRWFMHRDWNKVAQSELDRVKALVKRIELELESQLVWQGVTLIFIGQTIEKMRIAENQFISGRQNYEWATEQLMGLLVMIGAYRQKIRAMYRAMGLGYKARQWGEKQLKSDTNDTQKAGMAKKSAQISGLSQVENCRKEHFKEDQLNEKESVSQQTAPMGDKFETKPSKKNKGKWQRWSQGDDQESQQERQEGKADKRRKKKTKRSQKFSELIQVDSNLKPIIEQSKQLPPMTHTTVTQSTPPIIPTTTFSHFELYTPSPLPSDHQIFFRYGSLSNRTLLLRYGFTFSPNFCEHVWLSLPIGDVLMEYPDLYEKVMERGVAVESRLKIRRWKKGWWPRFGNGKGSKLDNNHCLDGDKEDISNSHHYNKQAAHKIRIPAFLSELVLFHRCLSWRINDGLGALFSPTNQWKELQSIKWCRQLLAQQMIKWNDSPVATVETGEDGQLKEQNKESQFKDYPQSNRSKSNSECPQTHNPYHQYFIEIYRFDKLKILQENIELLDDFIRQLSASQ